MDPASSARGCPPAFAHLARFERRGGRIALYGRERPATLLVVPEGYVGPGLLRAELARAEIYGMAHPGGWTYLVDTSRVRLVNPLNLLWLRRIRRLPHLSRYLVLAPSRPARALLRVLGRAVGVDAVLAPLGDSELP